MPLLEVKNLQVSLGRGKSRVTAVEDVSFTIVSGSIMGLIGESGSGKSTVGKSIMGIAPIHSGHIFFEGRDIVELLKKEPPFYRKNVQMIFQDIYSSLNPKKRVFDILTEPIKNFEKLSKAEELKRVEELLEIVGLNSTDVSKYPKDFSGGQRQRIGIARAIALKPKLIIADEPVSALDLSIQAQILNYLKDIQERLDLSILFISHDLGVVKYMCEKLAIMHKGRIVEQGSRKDIYENPQHIYTKSLIAAIPSLDAKIREENAIKRQLLATLRKDSQ